MSANLQATWCGICGKAFRPSENQQCPHCQSGTEGSNTTLNQDQPIPSAGAPETSPVSTLIAGLAALSVQPQTRSTTAISATAAQASGPIQRTKPTYGSFPHRQATNKKSVPKTTWKPKAAPKASPKPMASLAGPSKASSNKPTSNKATPQLVAFACDHAGKDIEKLRIRVDVKDDKAKCTICNREFTQFILRCKCCSAFICMACDAQINPSRPRP